MNRKIIILLILAGFPIYSCKVTRYQASSQRNHITKPMLRPPKKGSGQSRCLVTLNEEARRGYPDSALSEMPDGAGEFPYKHQSVNSFYR